MYVIKKIVPSPRKNKRFVAVVEDLKNKITKLIHFGFKLGRRVGKTFLDGASEDDRENYRLRHWTEKERPLIEGLIPSPSLFSWYLLWGPSNSLSYNVEYLNRLFQKKELGLIK